MNHFKALALGTALLLTATVETQAAGCYSCPTGQVSFNCSAGKCTGTLTNSTSGTWSAQASSASSHFIATLTSAGSASYAGSEIICTYASTSTQPVVTLTWLTLLNKTITCKADSSCGANKFSCS